MNSGETGWAPTRPRLFFMHIPKTAGMALRIFLGNQYPVAQIMPATDWAGLAAVDIASLAQYRLFQGHFGAGLLDIMPSDTRPVAFLREPIARVVSHLRHLRRDPNFHPAHRLAAGRSIDELARDERIMRLCANIQVAHFSNDLAPAAVLAQLRRDREAGRSPDLDDYASPPDLDKALGMLERFAYIGFVETLPADLLQL